MKIKDYFLSQEIFELVDSDVPGILKTQPVPSNLAAYYESTDYISHHQDTGSLKEKLYKFLQNFNLKYKKNILTRYAPEALRILDYGCGAGEFVKFIENDYETVGYEPNDKAATAAKRKVSKAKIIHNIHNQPTNSLDVICLWHVFEHVEHQKEILELFYQKLTSGGKLIIAVPNPNSFDAIRYKQFWAAYDVPRHLYHFTKAGMKNLLHQNNYKITNIEPLYLDSFYISMLSEKYQKSNLFWLKGLLWGAISNFKASKTGEYSSLIYIIGKN